MNINENTKTKLMRYYDGNKFTKKYKVTRQPFWLLSHVYRGGSLGFSSTAITNLNNEL